MATTKRYPLEVLERAVRLVFEHQHEHGSQWATITSIASKFGMTPQTLCSWVVKPKVTRVGVRGSRPMNGSGSRNSSGRTGSCAERMRS